MKNKTGFFKVWLLFVMMLTGSAAQVCAQAPGFDDRPLRVAIEDGEVFTTLRFQSFSGNWKLVFSPGQPPLNSVGSVLASATDSIATISEILTEGEDASLMLIPKGIVARLSTEKDLDKGYGSISVDGGELLSLEIPGQSPIILQGRVTITHEDNRLKIVNHLSIKQFIISSVSKMCFSNEPEVLKAMIIVIRTRLKYLLDHSTHTTQQFDICDSDHCLSFAGCGLNRELVDILTGMMENKILVYKNQPVSPRFHHTCGGRISSAKDVFGTDTEPYHPAHDDIFEGKGSENCFHSPSFHWTVEIQKHEILDFLSIIFAAGADRIIANWEPEKVDKNGRISTVILRGKKPKSVNGAEFLEKLQSHFGSNSIKSMKFNIEMLRRSVIFRGMGQGDGVGMCLYGADGLAKKNIKYTQILNTYYPGTEIK